MVKTQVQQRLNAYVIWTGEDFHAAGSMWRSGKNTMAIAAYLLRPEYEVWSRLDAIKALAK